MAEPRSQAWPVPLREMTSTKEYLFRVDSPPGLSRRRNADREPAPLGVKYEAHYRPQSDPEWADCARSTPERYSKTEVVRAGKGGEALV